MKNKKAILTPNPMLPNHVVTIDETLCVACYQCSDICRCNVIVHHPDGDKPPLLVYPDECWHCAVCTEHCPTGAIKFEHPINQKITWKRKETGEMFRIGMANPPKANTRRACGDERILLEDHETIEMETLEVERLSRFFIRAKFGNAGVEKFDFKPGHFANLKIDDETYRGYSIGNAPGDDYIEIFADTFPDGKGSKFFKAIEVGKKVELTMPLGRFIYHPKDTAMFMVAGGTGISPIKSMLETELYQLKSGRKIELVFIVWDVEDIFLKDYFDKLEAEFPNFSYSYLFANPDKRACDMNKVINVDLDEYIANNSDITPETDAYICGSKPLIKQVENLFSK